MTHSPSKCWQSQGTPESQPGYRAGTATAGGAAGRLLLLPVLCPAAGVEAQVGNVQGGGEELCAQADGNHVYWTCLKRLTG
eukprot:scaffold188786_cov28-Tisochrysis_lutea.AAC.3